MKFTLTLHGATPLVMHSGRLQRPVNPETEHTRRPRNHGVSARATFNRTPKWCVSWSRIYT